LTPQNSGTNEWPVCGESGESAGRLGFRTEWHIHGHNRWWKHVAGPQCLLNFFAGDELARPLEQQGENLDGMALQLQFEAVLV